MRAIKISIVKRLECMDIDTRVIDNDLGVSPVNSANDEKSFSNKIPVENKSFSTANSIKDKKVIDNDKSNTMAVVSNTSIQISADSSTGIENYQTSTNSSKSIGGNGIVNIKHVVYGYVKLSTITHSEIEKNELILSPMEYDSHALWLDTEANILSSTLPDYNAGVHALSHAILAVIPLFVACAIYDVDCDHSLQYANRLLLYDVTVGGSGTCAQIWKCMFQHNNGDGIFKAALDLLRHCPSCDNSCDKESVENHSRGQKYCDSGCPACLHSCPCANYKTGQSRKAAVAIGERMHKRWMSAFDNNAILVGSNNNSDSTTDTSLPGLPLSSPSSSITRKRTKSPQNAHNHYHNQMVVGRSFWPCFDQNNDLGTNDYGCAKTNKYSTSEKIGIQGGGFIEDKNK